jgi:hypothetical protein
MDQFNRQYGSNPPFLVIGGQEISQAVDANTRIAHVNGLNTDKEIEPVGGWSAIAPPGVSMADTYIRNINEIYAAGGIPEVNHPAGLWGVHLGDLLPIQRPFLFEVWNGVPSIGNLGGEDENGLVTPSFEALWDSLLSHGKIVWGVAVDDTHTYSDWGNLTAALPGKAWIVIRAPELTVQAVMAALRNGRFYASNGVSLKTYQADDHGISITMELPLLWRSDYKMPVLYKTRFIGRDGKVLKEMAGMSPHYEFKGDEEYVRASIIDSDGRRAWTQPVFRDKRRTN